MRSGDLDRRITLQSFETVSDGAGGSTTTWVDLATVWASVQQQSGREYFALGTTQTEVKRVFRLRWRNDITTLQRVVYDGQNHNIDEVKELGRRAGLELHATATGSI